MLEVEQCSELDQIEGTLEKHDGGKDGSKVFVVPELLEDFNVHPIDSGMFFYDSSQPFWGYPPGPDILRQCGSENE